MDIEATGGGYANTFFTLPRSARFYPLFDAVTRIMLPHGARVTDSFLNANGVPVLVIEMAWDEYPIQRRFIRLDVPPYYEENTVQTST